MMPIVITDAMTVTPFHFPCGARRPVGWGYGERCGAALVRPAVMRWRTAEGKSTKGLCGYVLYAQERRRTCQIA